MWCQMQFLCAIWCLLISIWENQFKINNLSRSIRFYKAFLHFSPHNNNFWFWNVKKGTSLKFGIEGWCMLHMNNFTLLLNASKSLIGLCKHLLHRDGLYRACSINWSVSLLLCHLWFFSSFLFFFNFMKPCE